MAWRVFFHIARNIAADGWLCVRSRTRFFVCVEQRRIGGACNVLYYMTMNKRIVSKREFAALRTAVRDRKTRNALLRVTRDAVRSYVQRLRSGIGASS